MFNIHVWPIFIRFFKRLSRVKNWYHALMICLKLTWNLLLKQTWFCIEVWQCCIKRIYYYSFETTFIFTMYLIQDMLLSIMWILMTLLCTEGAKEMIYLRLHPLICWFGQCFFSFWLFSASEHFDCLCVTASCGRSVSTLNGSKRLKWSVKWMMNVN